MSKKTKSTTDPSKFAKPFIQGAAGDIQANNANLQANAGMINQLLPGIAQQFQQGTPSLNAANDYATSVLGGQYLGQGNPYLNQIVQQTGNDVADQVNSRFGMAGRTGGTQHVQALGRELANSENQLRYGDYAGERDRQQQAMGAVPGLTGAQQAPLQSLLAAAQTGGTLPLAGSQAMGGLMGGYNTSTQKTGAMQSIGQLAGLGMMAFGGGGPFGKMGAFG